MLVWFSGSMGVAQMWFSRLRRMTVIVRGAVEGSFGREAIILRRLNSSGTVPLLLTGEHVEPGVIGIVRPVLIWPIELSDSLDDKQMEAILKHELLHVSRRDNMTLALHMLVETVFWFHPMVWWIAWWPLRERERACDEAVMLAGSEADVYASGILQACGFCLDARLPCIAGISVAELNGRIRSIMSFNSAHMRRGAKISIQFSALLLVALPVMYGMVRVAPFYGQILHAEGPLPTFEVASIRPWKARPTPSPAQGGSTPPKIVKEVPMGDSGNPLMR